MARGLNVTFGTATTDEIKLALTAHATLRTYAGWFYAGALDLNARLFDKRDGADAQVELMFVNTNVIRYERAWTSGTGAWTMAYSTTGSWSHIAMTYDAGATSNNPQFYLNGASVTTTTVTSPTSGAGNTNTSAYILGNRSNDNIRCWNGNIAEFGIWDRLLTADEIRALGAGAAPSFLPRSLMSYVHLVRELNDSQGAVAVATGALVQPHPRIWYPRSSQTPVSAVQIANLAGNVVAAGTMTATALKSTPLLSGSVVAAGTMTAALSSPARISTFTANGAGTMAATLIAPSLISGFSAVGAGTMSVTQVLTTPLLIGTVTAAGTMTGALSSTPLMTGTVTAAGTMSAALLSTPLMAGSVVATGTMTATLISTPLLSGAVVAAFSFQATDVAHLTGFTVTSAFTMTVTVVGAGSRPINGIYVDNRNATVYVDGRNIGAYIDGRNLLVAVDHRQTDVSIDPRRPTIEVDVH